MRYIPVILSALAAAGLAVWCGFVCWYDYGLWSLTVYASIIAAFPLSSLLHELGHMLFGLFCKIKAVPDFRPFGSSSCSLMPRGDKSLKTRVCVTAAGGLIVNAAFAALGLVALCVPACPSYLCAFLPASAYLLVLNAFPAVYSGGKTDGLVILGMMLGDDESKVTLAVMTVQAQLADGKPIGEIDENLLFGVPQISEDEEAFIALTELRYEYCNAKGDGEKAEFYKRRFEELKEEYL